MAASSMLLVWEVCMWVDKWQMLGMILGAGQEPDIYKIGCMKSFVTVAVMIIQTYVDKWAIGCS